MTNLILTTLRTGETTEDAEPVVDFTSKPSNLKTEGGDVLEG